MENTAWYHGGDFKNGSRKGDYVYITDNRPLAEWYASEHRTPENPNGILYRVRPQYHHLVTDRHDGTRTKVILQNDLTKLGGALSVFEEV